MDPLLEKTLTDHLDSLYRFAFNRTHSDDRASDLTQEILLEAICSYAKLRDKDRIEGWLWGIARNVYLRSVSQKENIQFDDTLLAEHTPLFTEDLYEAFAKNSDFQNLRKSLSYLEKLYREVLIAFYLREKSYMEIAAELRVPLSTVRWRLAESKKILKEEYEKMTHMNETMKNGYWIPVDYEVHLSEYTVKNEKGRNSERALETLLAKNIAAYAYQMPRTVTEISEALGIPAQYTEDLLTAMEAQNLVSVNGKRYLTEFPIISKETSTQISHFIQKEISLRIPALVKTAGEGLKSFEEKYPCTNLYRYDHDAPNFGTRLYSILRGAYNDFYNSQRDNGQYDEIFEKGYYTSIGWENGAYPAPTMTNHTTDYPCELLDHKSLPFFTYATPGFALAEPSPNMIRILYRIHAGEDFSDIPDVHYETAKLLESNLIEKTESGYRLRFAFYQSRVNPYHSSDSAEISPGELAYYNNHYMTPYFKLLYQIWDDLNQAGAAELKCHLPQQITFTAPIIHQYMKALFDHSVYAHMIKVGLIQPDVRHFVYMVHYSALG